jgi:hypothetical protein
VGLIFRLCLFFAKEREKFLLLRCTPYACTNFKQDGRQALGFLLLCEYVGEVAGNLAISSFARKKSVPLL